MKFVSRKELLFSFSFSWKRFPLSREFPFSKSRHENRIKREYDTREMVLDPPKKDGSSKFLAEGEGRGMVALLPFYPMTHETRVLLSFGGACHHALFRFATSRAGSSSRSLVTKKHRYLVRESFWMIGENSIYLRWNKRRKLMKENNPSN